MGIVNVTDMTCHPLPDGGGYRVFHPSQFQPIGEVSQENDGTLGVHLYTQGLAKRLLGYRTQDCFAVEFLVVVWEMELEEQQRKLDRESHG